MLAKDLCYGAKYQSFLASKDCKTLVATGSKISTRPILSG